MTATESQARAAALNVSVDHTRALFEASQTAFKIALDHIDKVTGERDRARATAVRFEQEIAHMLDDSDEAVDRLAAVYKVAYKYDAEPGSNNPRRNAIRAVLAALAGTE